ncbi:type II thioesterase [Mycobacterium tuberculosis]|nr:type II thioesterase [Mycobacterium tuberculosis]
MPVQFSIAEYEKVWQTDDSAVGEITGLFSGSPRFTVNRQPEAGHNISLGYSAPDYHRKVFAFVDECAAGLSEAPSTTEEAG